MVEPGVAALHHARGPRGQGAAQRLGRAALARLARRGLAGGAGRDRRRDRRAGSGARRRRRVPRRGAAVRRLRRPRPCACTAGSRPRPCRASRSTCRSRAGSGGRSPTVHGLALRPRLPELYAGRTGLTTADVWPDLVVAFAGGGRAVDRRARARASALARRASALLVDDGSATVLAHGDVDQKNLLVARRRPAAHRLGRRAPGRCRRTTSPHAARDDGVLARAWRRRRGRPGLRRGARARRHRLRRRATSGRRSPRGWAGSGSRSTVHSTRMRTTGRGRPRAADLADLLADLERRAALAESWPGWLGRGVR